MSEHVLPLVRLSLDRSRTRRRVLLALASLRAGYVGQLAQVAGVRRERVRAVLVGGPPAFSEALSLVASGCALSRWDGRGVVYEITPRGARQARAPQRARCRAGRGRSGG